MLQDKTALRQVAGETQKKSALTETLSEITWFRDVWVLFLFHRLCCVFASICARTLHCKWSKNFKHVSLPIVISLAKKLTQTTVIFIACMHSSNFWQESERNQYVHISQSLTCMHDYRNTKHLMWFLQTSNQDKWPKITKQMNWTKSMNYIVSITFLLMKHQSL